MTQKTPLEALEATIADFKAHPAMRTSLELALNSEGAVVDPQDPKATCFCAVGLYVRHRNAPPVPRPGESMESGYYRLLEQDGVVEEASDIWAPNDADETETGEHIIPVLEGIRDRLKATLEASAA